MEFSKCQHPLDHVLAYKSDSSTELHKTQHFGFQSSLDETVHGTSHVAQISEI